MRGRGRSEVVLLLRRLFTQRSVHRGRERKAGNEAPPLRWKETKLICVLQGLQHLQLPKHLDGCVGQVGFIGCLVTKFFFFNCPQRFFHLDPTCGCGSVWSRVRHLPKVPQRPHSDCQPKSHL